MNLDYIYINPIDLKINLIYLPFEQAFSEDCGLKYIDIVKRIIIEFTNFENGGTADIVQKILNYLKNDWVSIIEFNEFLEEFGQGNVKVFYGESDLKEQEPEKPIILEPVPVVEISKKESILKSFLHKFKRKNKKNKKSTSRNADTGLINPTSKSPAKREIMTEMSYETILLDSKAAYLVSIKAGTVEKIHIDKDVFKIGRRLGEVDYVTDNKAVGKIHMEFRLVNSKYYIVDLNSRNGTFINGKRLEPNKEYIVENKDIIMLANCKFTFQIE